MRSSGVSIFGVSSSSVSRSSVSSSGVSSSSVSSSGTVRDIVSLFYMVILTRHKVDMKGVYSPPLYLN